jgi:DNA-binding transcriptional ArsR family regulator
MSRRARRAPARAAPLTRTAPLFAALGDETRLVIVARLSSGAPLSIVRLAEGTGVTRQAITKHLLVLAHAGLVRSARTGRERVWELEPAPLREAQRSLARISAQWDDALSRLKQLVEGGARTNAAHPSGVHRATAKTVDT